MFMHPILTFNRRDTRLEQRRWENEKLFNVALIICSIALFVGYASTGTYGKSFEPINGTNNYRLKIYTGGTAFNAVATEHLMEETEEYKALHDYKSYKIISSSYEVFPSGFEYVVQFEK